MLANEMKAMLETNQYDCKIETFYVVSFNSYTRHCQRMLDFFAGMGIKIEQDLQNEVPMDFYRALLTASQYVTFESWIAHVEGLH